VLLSNTYWPDVQANAASIVQAIALAVPGSFTIVPIETKD
jgi:hypothetical protein